MYNTLKNLFFGIYRYFEEEFYVNIQNAYQSIHYLLEFECGKISEMVECGLEVQCIATTQKVLKILFKNGVEEITQGMFVV